MTATVCKYCAPTGTPDAHTMPFIAALRVSDVFLFPDQTHRGRCVVAFRGQHVEELHTLTEAERNAFSADVAQVSAVVQALTQCDKINYAAYGDLAPHLHFHIVPKHKNGPHWGEPFVLNPVPLTTLDANDEQALIAALSARLHGA